MILTLYLMRLATFGAAAALLVLIPTLASAAAEMSGATMNFGGLWDSLAPLVSAAAEGAVVAIIGWIGLRVRVWTGLAIEARHREALHSAAVTGVDLALSRIGDRVDRIDVDLRSAVLADAAAWVARSVPDALAHLGVTPDKVRDLVESKLRDAGLRDAGVFPAAGG